MALSQPVMMMRSQPSSSAPILQSQTPASESAGVLRSGKALPERSSHLAAADMGKIQAKEMGGRGNSGSSGSLPQEGGSTYNPGKVKVPDGAPLVPEWASSPSQRRRIEPQARHHDSLSQSQAGVFKPPATNEGSCSAASGSAAPHSADSDFQEVTEYIQISKEDWLDWPQGKGKLLRLLGNMEDVHAREREKYQLATGSNDAPLKSKAIDLEAEDAAAERLAERVLTSLWLLRRRQRELDRRKTLDNRTTQRDSLFQADSFCRTEVEDNKVMSVLSSHPSAPPPSYGRIRRMWVPEEDPIFVLETAGDAEGPEEVDLQLEEKENKNLDSSGRQRETESEQARKKLRTALSSNGDYHEGSHILTECDSSQQVEFASSQATEKGKTLSAAKVEAQKALSTALRHNLSLLRTNGEKRENAVVKNTNFVGNAADDQRGDLTAHHAVPSPRDHPSTSPNLQKKPKDTTSGSLGEDHTKATGSSTSSEAPRFSRLLQDRAISGASPPTALSADKEALESSDSKKSQLQIHIRESISALSKGTVEKKRQAALMLSRLTWKSLRNRMLVVQAGAVAPLLTLLKEGSEEAAEALRNLISLESVKTSIAQADAIPALVQLVKSGSMTARQKSAGILWSLALDSDKNQAAIAAGGGIAPLVDLLEIGNPQAKEEASGALLDLACNQQNQVLIAEAGGIPALLEVLRTGSVIAKERAAIAVGNLACNAENEQKIIQMGGVETLLALAKGGSLNAANALRTFR